MKRFLTALFNKGNLMQILEPQQFATWNEPIDMLYACGAFAAHLLEIYLFEI